MRRIKFSQFLLALCSTPHFGLTITSIGDSNESLRHAHLFSQIDTIFYSQVHASNVLRATHAGAALIGNQDNINRRLTITLPSIGDATFSYRSYELIGSRVKGTDVVHTVWTGDLDTDSIIVDRSVSFFGDATFVLLPNGDLICSVQVGARKFKCQPCSLIESSYGEITSCVDIFEIVEEFPDGTLLGISGSDVPPARGYMRKLPKKVNEHHTFEKRKLLDDGSVIDILVFYTQLSMDYYGSEDLLKSNVALYVAKNNLIFSNNEIDLEIQVVGWQLSDYVETATMQNANNFITYNSTVADIRDEVGADFVIILTMDSDYCSFVWLLNPVDASGDIYAFSAVRPSCLETMGSLYTAVGSVFGCDQDSENRFQVKSVEYAYAYQSTECDFHTAMAVKCGSSVRVPYYSTPNFKWSETGELLGSAESADCSRLISETKLIVSQYRDAIVDLTVPPVSTPTGITTPPPTPVWIEARTVIDVLFLYTAAVVVQYGSEELAKEDVFKYVEESNNVFLGSLIDFEVQVVGWEELDYTEPNDMVETYDYIANDSGVAELRDSVGADLVILLSTDNNYCSYALMPNPVEASSEVLSFIVLRPECMETGSLLYQWGTIFGCNPNYEDSDQDRVIEYAYAYQSTDCSFHTIMSEPCGESVQVPFYSNPNLRWVETGELLGSAETADCARVMNDYKLIVSAYRDTVVGITLPTAPTFAPTATKAPTPLPTAVWVETIDITPVPTPAPTPAPSNNLVEYPDDGKIYTARFRSYLVGQGTWTTQMEDVFLLMIKNIVSSVAKSGDVAVESAVQGVYGYRSSRALQLSNSIEAIYRISNIPGNSSASALSAELIAQSENDTLIKNLQLYPNMFDDFTKIETEIVGDPVVQTSGDSFSTVMIIIICVIIAFILVSSYFIWRYWTKLTMYCRAPPKKNNDNSPKDAITQSIRDVPPSRENEAPRAASNRDVPPSRENEAPRAASNRNVPVAYDVGTPKILSTVVVSAAWDGMRVVASNLPYIRALFGVCDGIFGLFSNYQNQDDNIKQVMNWISNIKSILTSLEQNLKQYPEAQSVLNKGQLDECKLCLENLLRLSATHQSNQMLVQFALSTKMKELIEEASAALDSAISRLNLSVGVSMLGITLRIDENVSTLISVVHEMKVDISAIAANINRVMKVARFPSAFSKTVSDLTTSLSGGGEGPDLNEKMLSEAPNALKQLEVTQDSYERISVRPIGIGGSAKVYLVKFKGMRCAAKVVSLIEVPQDQLQDVYLKFTCELYILNLLKHPRIVELRGSISNITEYTLLLEYMEQGSLRKVLNIPRQWNDLTPKQRHMILHDIAEGMDFLHQNKMHHRDLKSQNILLTTDFRAKISDFGMSKTSATVTTFTRAESRVQSGGGTLAWMAPENFRPQNIGTPRVGDKGDVYSYGIVIWEVISGIFGVKSSTPWRGLADSQVITKVLNGERPKLLDGWDKEGNVLGANFYMDIMQECFEVLPGDRPSFSVILQLLKNVEEEKYVIKPRSFIKPRSPLK